VQYHYVLIDFYAAGLREISRRQRCGRSTVVHREELPELKLAEDTVDVIRKGFSKA